MKKSLFLSMLILVGVVFSAVAKDQTEYKYPFQEASVSYRNVLVYRVLDHKDAYVVMYAKGHKDVGNISIPKKWYSSAANANTKLSFRPLPKGMSPYMTVIYRDGNFERAILTMPTSRADAAWGVADSNVTINDADKETLEVAY